MYTRANQRGKTKVRLRALGLILIGGTGLISATAEEPWTTPRTSFGHPDLQGIWTMATYTPLERPAHLEGKEFFTEEETTELQEVFTAEGVDPLRARTAITQATAEKRDKMLRQTKENIHYDNSIWLRTKKPRGISTNRTSLIVAPPDGRVPPLPERRRREGRNSLPREGSIAMRIVR